MGSTAKKTATKPSTKASTGRSTMDRVQDVPRRFVEGGWDFVKNTANALSHPLETAGAVNDLATGGWNQLYRQFLPAELSAAAQDLPQETMFKRGVAQPTARAARFAKEHPREVPGKVGNYALDNPFDVALLASMGAGTAAKGAEAAGFARTANALGKISEVTNPITAPLKATRAAVRPVGRGLSKLGKEVLGTSTGAGKGAIDVAVQGGPAFERAMRGQITGEEIVDNAKNALSVIKNNRGAAYRAKLEEISKITEPIDPEEIWGKVQKLMDSYGIKVDRGKRTIDMSRTGLGARGVKDIKNVINTLMGWGSKPGDFTPAGLDILKKQLGDFYSDSSNARGFVSATERAVKDTIVKNVPEYATMTKGYEEATRLIKDIESNLMLRKEGISGRITADQTLRRLSSALRENFDMRRDLLQALGTEAGADIEGQVAGYAMSQWTPRGGLAKIGAGGSALSLGLFNPKLWPVLVAGSPRVVGEFLNAYGKAARALRKPAQAVKAAAKEAASSKDLVPAAAVVEPAGSQRKWKSLGILEE